VRYKNLPPAWYKDSAQDYISDMKDRFDDANPIKFGFWTIYSSILNSTLVSDYTSFSAEKDSVAITLPLDETAIMAIENQPGETEFEALVTHADDSTWRFAVDLTGFNTYRNIVQRNCIE
jgi:hypothetical protein